MNLFLGHTKKGLKKFMEIHESRGCWPVKVHIDVEKFGDSNHPTIFWAGRSSSCVDFLLVCFCCLRSYFGISPFFWYLSFVHKRYLIDEKKETSFDIVTKRRFKDVAGLETSVHR